MTPWGSLARWFIQKGFKNLIIWVFWGCTALHTQVLCRWSNTNPCYISVALWAGLNSQTNKLRCWILENCGGFGPETLPLQISCRFSVVVCRMPWKRSSLISRLNVNNSKWIPPFLVIDYELWLHRFIYRFWLIDAAKFSIWNYPQVGTKRKEIFHAVSLGSIILGFDWLVSSNAITVDCRTLREGVGCAGEMIALTVNSDTYIFPFRLQKEGLKIKCRSSAFIHYKFVNSNHTATVTGSDFQLWKGEVKGSRKWTSI